MSMPTLPNKGGSSKSLLMFGSDGLGSLTSAPNQLVCNALITIFLSFLVYFDGLIEGSFVIFCSLK